MKNNDFLNSIVIKQDEEKLKILKLQRDYKAGKILEEDMTKEEHKKLIELYKMQNRTLKEKLKIKLNKLKTMLSNYSQT